MEDRKKLPPRMAVDIIERELRKIGIIIEKMADPDIFIWLSRNKTPNDTDIHRAATPCN